MTGADRIDQERRNILRLLGGGGATLGSMSLSACLKQLGGGDVSARTETPYSQGTDYNTDQPTEEPTPTPESNVDLSKPLRKLANPWRFANFDEVKALLAAPNTIYRSHDSKTQSGFEEDWLKGLFGNSVYLGVNPWELETFGIEDNSGVEYHETMLSKSEMVDATQKNGFELLKEYGPATILRTDNYDDKYSDADGWRKPATIVAADNEAFIISKHRLETPQNLDLDTVTIGEANSAGYNPDSEEGKEGSKVGQSFLDAVESAQIMVDGDNLAPVTVIEETKSGQGEGLVMTRAPPNAEYAIGLTDYEIDGNRVDWAEETKPLGPESWDQDSGWRT